MATANVIAPRRLMHVHPTPLHFSRDTNPLQSPSIRPPLLYFLPSLCRLYVALVARPCSPRPLPSICLYRPFPTPSV